MEEIMKTYPEKNQDVLQNLVDSHDTERLSSLINNPDRNYDRDGNDGNPNYNPGKPDSSVYEKQKLIAAFQMTWKGAPMIYYGDEVGMWGADDPHDRNPMVWDNLKYDDEVITAESGFSSGLGTYKVEQNKDLFKYYKKIIAIRNQNPPLKDGDAKFIYSNDESSVFAFERHDRKGKILTVFNTGKTKADVELNTGFNKFTYKNLFSGEKGSGTGTDNSLALLKVSTLPGSVNIFSVNPEK
jgi:glycosidase